MQDFLDSDPALMERMRDSLSAPRFARYLADSGGDERRALLLYQWNSLLSQSLYLYIQCWEICLRNKLNGFLCWKYNAQWPYDSKRAVRNMAGNDRRRLEETIQRQESERGGSPVGTDVIVADLSAGFWVSQLSSAYDVPYKWRYNLQRVFPEDRVLDRPAAWGICEEALGLRNRIAHHEPIYHLPLEARYRDLQRIVSAMCPGTYAFADTNCSFRKTYAARPA